MKEWGTGFLGVLAETAGYPHPASSFANPRRNGGGPARSHSGEGGWDRTPLRIGHLKDGDRWRAGSHQWEKDGGHLHPPQPSVARGTGGPAGPDAACLSRR